VFDPFGDYETRGYLRNFECLKRMDEVKVLEHTFFEANLEDAFHFLGAIKGPLTYTIKYRYSQHAKRWSR
jgi:cell filamentation protein